MGKFLAVGLLATIVSLILFNFLVHGFNTAHVALLNDQPELAYVLANVVGMAISFHGTKGWAFKDREARHADGGVVAFVLINFATMLIPLSCLYLSRNVLGLDDPISDNISANLVGLLLANVARFFVFRYYVFRRPQVFGFKLTDREVEQELTEPTGRSTSDRVPPSAP